MVAKVVGVSFLESLAGAQGALHVPVDKLELENFVYLGEPILVWFPKASGLGNLTTLH